MDTTFEFSIYAGAILTVVALLWLILSAWSQSFGRGLLVTFVPVLIPWHIATGRPRPWRPAILLGAGLLLLAFPPLYTRLMPLDLGPRVAVVEGEQHITLTGWDRKDYRALGQYPDCVVLQMANADVTDETLAHLAGMSRLRELDLDHTQITDAGLPAVGALPNLERLRIARTRVTDAGFSKSLASHPRLKQLWCPETAIQKSTLDAWKKAAPGRRFSGGQSE